MRRCESPSNCHLEDAPNVRVPCPHGDVLEDVIVDSILNLQPTTTMTSAAPPSLAAYNNSQTGRRMIIKEEQMGGVALSSTRTLRSGMKTLCTSLHRSMHAGTLVRACMLCVLLRGAPCTMRADHDVGRGRHLPACGCDVIVWHRIFALVWQHGYQHRIRSMLRTPMRWPQHTLRCVHVQ